MLADVPRVLISATASGAGKTTVTCGLLRTLQRRGVRVRAGKCGPDFIDPQFHRAVLGVPSYNLDLFLAGEVAVRELVGQAAGSADLLLMEGAMGYYDGIAQGHDASAYDVARATQTPAVLVVDARGRALSVAAEVAGFARFREPSFVAGVILNRVSPGYYPQLKAMVERETNVSVLGYVPVLGQDVVLQSRHLGLVQAGEVSDLQARVDTLADAIRKTVDIEALIGVAHSAEPFAFVPRRLPEPCPSSHPLVAVARDDAFSFYYDESLEMLERVGARLAFFSPLRDGLLPKGACGLYVGGGYPELYARELSQNVSMRKEIQSAIAAGMPTIAECGGFLYLHKTLEDTEGNSWPMVGVVDAQAYRQERMGNFGYATLTAHHDGLLARAGESMPAHEFHYWQSTAPGIAFCARKPQSARNWQCGVSTPTMYAGFPHLYLYGQPAVAKRFVEACVAFGVARGVC